MDKCYIPHKRRIELYDSFNVGERFSRGKYRTDQHKINYIGNAITHSRFYRKNEFLKTVLEENRRCFQVQNIFLYE